MVIGTKPVSSMHIECLFVKLKASRHFLKEPCNTLKFFKGYNFCTSTCRF